MNHLIVFIYIFILFSNIEYSSIKNNDTFSPLKNGNVPQTVEELWEGFDPRKEPLDVEILKEWEEDGIVMQVLRYRIGIFKGQKAMMAAIFGYPKRGVKVPGLVQIHGGGQYADYRAVFTNAKRGYATISIAWAGRINAPSYYVDSEIVKLFWEGDTSNPNYKLTTDWGAVDGYHAPSRNSDNSFVKIPTASWTLDSIASPRNNSWFLCTVGSRRALTFLEQQPEVDPDKLGVYGHSMGGKLTVLTAIDSRVKAAAPSCGGVSDRYNEDPLFCSALGDDQYLKRISCPIIFLSPANDFHGSIYDLQKATREINSKVWRVTCSAHHNHQDSPEFMVTGLLWFDQFLKGTFEFPETLKSFLELKSTQGIPIFSVTPDPSKPIQHVDIYYTQQGQAEGESMENKINRFWHHADAKKKGNTWIAELPVFDLAKPIWAYANVFYPLDKPVTGAGYYYAIYTVKAYNLSSRMHVATPEDLKEAGVQATLKPSLMIEDFKRDWEKEWFTYKPEEWGRRTHKIYHDQWKPSREAKLEVEIRSEKPNKMAIGIDKYAAEIQLAGNSKWERFVFSPASFHNVSGEALPGWNKGKELWLVAQETLRGKGQENKSLQFGGSWSGRKPEFRNLRWIMNQETNIERNSGYEN